MSPRLFCASEGFPGHFIMSSASITIERRTCMPTAHKAEMIDELEQKLRDAKGAVVLDYRGLSVAAISALRRDLVKDNVEFMVAKNTLVRIAAERAQVD